MRKIYSNLDWEDYMDEARDYACNGATVDECYVDCETAEDIAREMCELDWETFYLPVLEKYFDHHKCVVSGSLGLWDGAYHGGTVIESSKDFYDLMMDCWYVELYEDDGCITIYGHHHDGTNNYVIRELTEKGKSWYENYGWDNKNPISYLFNYNFNSRKPQIDWCL